MSVDTIISLVIMVVGLYGSTGLCLYKSMTAKHEDDENERVNMLDNLRKFQTFPRRDALRRLAAEGGDLGRRIQMRVLSHVILGEQKDIEWVNIVVNGMPMKAKKGEMILAALLAEGIIVNRYTTKRHKPRGLFCGIGQCTDCMMVVNGNPGVCTCITPVEEGMTVDTQDGVGVWRGDK